MEDFLSQTAVQVAAGLLVAGLIALIGWVWRRPKQDSKVLMYIDAIDVSAHSREYLIAHCASMAVECVRESAALKRKLLGGEGQGQDASCDFDSLNASIQLGIRKSNLSRSERLEQIFLYNTADEPASVEIQNVGGGTVLLEASGVQGEIFSAPFEIKRHIPKDDYLKIMHFSPIAKADHITNATGLIMVREDGRPLLVRNRRYDLESSAAGRYLPNPKKARALFSCVDILEATFFTALIVFVIVIAMYLSDQAFGLF